VHHVTIFPRSAFERNIDSAFLTPFKDRLELYQQNNQFGTVTDWGETTVLQVAGSPESILSFKVLCGAGFNFQFLNEKDDGDCLLSSSNASYH
jgi:hypothetical protein